MDFNNLANMKLTDFENIGKEEFEKGYSKGFTDALTSVISVLNKKICEDYQADGICEHPICSHNFELSEALETVKRNRL